MKSQLMEDMVDSQSSLSPPLNHRPIRAAAPAAPAQASAPRARAGVWRARAPQPASLWRPRPPAPDPVPLQPEPQAAAAPQPPEPAPPVRPEPSLAAPDIASFSSCQPDWTAPPASEPAPWTERWGAKALGWSLALAAVIAVAGVGAWMVDETRVESSLAVVADHIPAKAQLPPAPEPAAEAPPPLRMLPHEALVAAVEEPVPVNVPELTTLPPVAAAPVEATQPAKRTEPRAPAIAKKPEARPPAAKRTQERRVAAAPVKRATPAVKKPPAKKEAQPKQPSERVLARALADAQRSRQESLARPGLSDETLRLCRAAGYHANACVKRACEATRFGLVCRG